MPDLIVETDLGHDPDDLFALCYLAAAGVSIRAITVVPGDPDQLPLARLFARVLGVDIPVGASHLAGRKPSSGGVHHRLLGRFGVPRSTEPDGPGDEVVPRHSTASRTPSSSSSAPARPPPATWPGRTPASRGG